MANKSHRPTHTCGVEQDGWCCRRRRSRSVSPTRSLSSRTRWVSAQPGEALPEVDLSGGKRATES